MNNITLDECFQFGLGAFETIGIEQGTPILLDKASEKTGTSGRFPEAG